MTTPMKSAAEVIAWSLEDRGLSPSDWSGHFADKVQEALDAAGYAIVPKKITQAMENAHFEAHAAAETFFADVQDVWSAIIEAATTPKEG